MESDRPSRRRHAVVVLFLTVALLSLPAIAVATHVFSDVQDGSTHAAGIHYVADTGITAGCTPTQYCPNDNLTRAQMGTFLLRASGNDPNTAPSVNAATVSAGAVQTVTAQNTVNANVNSATATCPHGTVAVGGGATTNNSTNWQLLTSRPSGQRQWLAVYTSVGGGAQAGTMTAYARCLAVGQ